MTVPGLLLGGITGAGIAARRGNLRGALAGAAIGAPLGMVGLRLAGRLEERQRLAGMLQPTEKKLSALNPALREFALVRDANGQLVEDGNGGGSGFKTAAKVGLGSAGAAGGAVLGTRWYHANKAIQAEGGIGKFYGDVKKMYAAGDSKGLQNLHERMSSNAQASARAGWMGKLGKVGNVLTKFSANLKPALRELAARSGRIVEFGDGGADEAVLGALKAVASADESSAQRAMLLKRGLIEMVAGQVVITERGYEMMQKAGMPPKLTPEERREEIAGTEEKRLSRFNHRGHRGHGVELARGDYFRRVTKLVEHLAPGSGSMQVGGFGRWSQVPSFAAERGSKVASGQAGWLKVFRPKVKPTGQTMNVGGKVWHENAGDWPYGNAGGLGLTKRHNALYTPEKRGF